MADYPFQTTAASSSSYVEMANGESGSNNNTNYNNSDNDISYSRNDTATPAQPNPPAAMALQSSPFSPEEIDMLKKLLSSDGGMQRVTSVLSATQSMDSEYPEFTESTHAWAVFADDPKKRATGMDRLVGTMIIVFQLFTYWMFASEAIEDYAAGQVVVTTAHGNCFASGEAPYDNFVCEAEVTNNRDAFVAFFMLGIFLTADFLQASRVLAATPLNTPSYCFALLAAVEVVAAYIAACIAVSYNLYIGEVTDAVEVGVGLLFIRELSQRAYAGIRFGETKQYKKFFSVLVCLIGFGMLMDPLCEHWFAVKNY